MKLTFFFSIYIGQLSKFEKRILINVKCINVERFKYRFVISDNDEFSN